MIRNGQPFFMVVWVGSIVAVLSTLVLGTLQLTGYQRIVMWCASGSCLLAVQGPTIRFGIPLNNMVRSTQP